MKNFGRAVGRLFYIPFLLIKCVGGYLIFPKRTPAPVRLRLFFQEAGGAILKVGQILAMRVDFLPEEYVQELLKLLDEVPPFDSAKAKEIVEQELRAPLVDLFEAFESEPMAAASFGQVYAATLQNGDEVVVKVQRPGVRETVAADLTLFRVGAFLVDATGFTGRTPLKPIVEDFEEWTKEELDYRIEGSHVQEVHNRAAESETERIPKVHWSHTSSKVLTLEHLHGLWVKEILQGLQQDKPAMVLELSKRGTSLTQVSQNLLRNTLRQIFVYGIFHVDLHAGNLLVMDDGAIGYVDFGITGRITEKSKVSQVKVHIALESGDSEQFYRAVVETIAPPYQADLSGFENEVKRGYTAWLNAQSMGTVNIQEKSFARLMLKLNEAARRNGIAFKSMEVRIFRALATMDAVLLQFSPTLDVRSEFRMFFGVYRVKRLVTYDIPKLLHRLPDLLEMASDRLDNTYEIDATYVSVFRRALGRLSLAASVVLAAAGVLALFVPRLVSLVVGRLQMNGGRTAGPVMIVAALLCAWMARLLRLRSVVQGAVMGRRTDACASERRWTGLRAG